MKKHQFLKSYSNRDELPFDAPRLALALKHLYEEFSTKPDRAPLPMHTQVDNPDFPDPQNPSVRIDPSLNIRAPDVAAPNILDAPLEENIPLQARLDRKRAVNQRIEELEKALEEKDRALQKSREALEKERESRTRMRRYVR